MQNLEVAGASVASERGRIREFKPRKRINDLLKLVDGDGFTTSEVEIKGWVRTVRNQKQFCFLQVNDGSNLSGIQIVSEPTTQGFELLEEGKIQTGASVRVRGCLVASPGAKQKVELQASEVEVIGECDSTSYPLQKKRHTLEFLRTIAHLRPRTNLIGAVARVRSALAFATHQFFQSSGFHYVHTPILSASDCEGAGEMFQVTTLLKDVRGPSPEGTVSEVEELKQRLAQQGMTVKDLKQRAAGEEEKNKIEEEVKVLLSLKEKLAAAEVAQSQSQLPFTPERRVDYTKDFFGEPTFLTVSGQLNGEMYACALGDVYTFGPTFRAENSNTARHLAEFWMIEPEMAFADLQDDMACAEAYLKHCVKYILDNCQEDLVFFDSIVEKGLIRRLQDVLEKPFATVTYTEAVKLLEESGKKFDFPVSWGLDLQSEHERYLTEVVFDKTPLMVTDYPRDIKAFYMRLNEDGRTVAAMDMLVPRVGELIGGSQREDRISVLTDRMVASGLNPEDYWWYLDLRRYGSVPHAGFGLGFERMVQFATGVENIRDVIPFPRYPDNCKF